MINILIADENIDFSINLINQISEKLDIRISKICVNGKEVLETLKNSKIDIIILDMIMPIYDGIEVLKRLADTQKEKYINSIIAISGNNCLCSQVIDNPLVYDFIDKGVSNEEIVNRIKRLVEIKNVQHKKR